MWAFGVFRVEKGLRDLDSGLPVFAGFRGVVSDQGSSCQGSLPPALVIIIR